MVLNGFRLNQNSHSKVEPSKDLEKSIDTKIKSFIRSKKEEKNSVYVILELFRMLENMKAESDKETLEYIEDFFYLFKGPPEIQIDFLELKYSISDDANKILEHMKKKN
ncbi:hypothetical protein H8356DRAFT_1360519 [Neocallimastix lanati (nom. inval.)]|nr:hypothetical protein H8356DRAFT_1360519 [Neocallimastix sp. JGI-2020a]